MFRAKSEGHTETNEITSSNNSSDETLLNYLQHIQMQSNYKPIVIKILIEKGIENNYTASNQEIKHQIELLNFDKKDFSLNNVDDSVYRALNPYVLFDGNTASLDYKFTSDDERKQCLKVCGQKIIQWHIENITNQNFSLWRVKPGRGEEGWKYQNEFLMTNSIGVGWNDLGDLSGFNSESDVNAHIDSIKPGFESKSSVTAISHKMSEKDIVVVTRAQQEIVDYGIIISKYEFKDKGNESYAHRRNVIWLNQGPIPKADFPDEHFGGSMQAAHEVHDPAKKIFIDFILNKQDTGDKINISSTEEQIGNDKKLDPEKFEELHEKFLKNIYDNSIKEEYTKEESTFTNFENKYLVKYEINPKNNIFVNAHNILEIGKWDEFIKTPGLISDKLEQVCVLKISQQLLTQGRWGEKTTPDDILRLLNQTQILDFEKIIYKLFLESPDEEIFSKNFDELYDFLYDNDLNKKSQFLAYLAFLVDKEKFIPIRKKQFDKVLEYYNINEKFSGFSWDRYNTYLKLIKALKVKLSEKYPIPNTIEAHSYLWIVSDILKNQAKIGDTVSNDVYARGLELKPNLILYGPPGTGKTYHAKVIAEKITYGQLTKIGICWPTDKDEEKIEDFQNIIKDNGKALWGVNWAIDQVNQYDFPIKGYVYYKQNIIAIASISNCTLHEETIDTDLKLRPEKWHKGLNYKNYLHLTSINRCELFSHKKLKLYDSIKVIPDIIQQRVYVKQLPEFISKVTFHPSYSYEDFVEGFRPNVSGVGEQPYILDDGIFKRICNQAKNDLKNKYVIIIDEINRGNIPKIFGELITLIEEDKRKSDNSLQLTYSKDDFFVPNNVIIIGTMNTADKSLMQMDDALKRRFAFEELMPDYSQLSAELLKREIPYAEEYVKILTRINEKITGDGKDNDLMKQFRDRQIGHSYFWNIGKDDRDPDDDLQKVFKYDIIPLLQDYFYGDYSKIREILGKKGEFAIIDENNRTTNLINDIKQCTELRAKLLDILE